MKSHNKNHLCGNRIIRLTAHPGTSICWNIAHCLAVPLQKQILPRCRFVEPTSAVSDTFRFNDQVKIARRNAEANLSKPSLTWVQACWCRRQHGLPSCDRFRDRRQTKPLAPIRRTWKTGTLLGENCRTAPPGERSFQDLPVHCSACHPLKVAGELPDAALLTPSSRCSRSIGRYRPGNHCTYPNRQPST